MKSLNVLFTLYSITAFVVIVERLSPTTKILLPPDNFIRLHELNQTVVFLSITVILSFLMLRLLTNNFQTVQRKGNTLAISLFVVGVYLYGSGEGWHEVASFTLNQYCNVNRLTGNLCKGLYINDYYAGNIIFFLGGVLINTSLMVLALKQQSRPFTNGDMAILLMNSIVYAGTWFAYAAFDAVIIGLLVSALLMMMSLGFVWRVKHNVREYPYLLYSSVAYTVATLATVIVKVVS